MARLTEDVAKNLLRACGIPVPESTVVTSPFGADDAARFQDKPVVVKALVPVGRRGKAGAVQKAAGALEVEKKVNELLGSSVQGHIVERVLVEQAINIAQELYLAFTFGPTGARVLACRTGGVDIEEMYRRHGELVVEHTVDHSIGLRRHHCVELWRNTGVRGPLLVGLADFTVRSWEAFRRLDGFLLEINPLAVDDGGKLLAVGAMLAVDDAALFRHPELDGITAEAGPGWRLPSTRETAVAAADRDLSGGRARYIELDGEIGLFVAGGGAGLMIHDLMVALGGRPANHTDITPGRTPDKLIAAFDAILTHPKVKSLLVCVNVLQMARADVVVEALVRSLSTHHVDPRRFPVVVRVFGPGEDRARALASELAGIRYLPPGATIEEAVKLIVELSARI